MNKAIAWGLTAAIASFALSAIAETQQIANTAYMVVTRMPQKVDLPNGKAVMSNGETHATLVDDKTGEQSSQWCTGDQFTDAKGMPVNAVGHCTVAFDNGDMLWVGYKGNGQGKPTDWTVLGGTGQYDGATGSGTTEVVSQRSDGYAQTMKSKGTIMTK